MVNKRDNAYGPGADSEPVGLDDSRFGVKRFHSDGTQC